MLTARKLYLRYLSLPRPYFLRCCTFSEQLNEHDRIYLTQWDTAPYYVKPTIWNRWGPNAWVTWAMGRPVPGDAGDKYCPSGYNIPDMGPRYMEGKGRKALELTMNELKGSRTGKCPFH